MSLLLFAILALAALATAIAQSLLSRIWREWSLRKIPGPPRASLITGNFAQFFRPDAAPFQDSLFAQYGPLHRLNGFFGAQILVTSDPGALHHIIVKRVDVFDTVDYFLKLTGVILGRGLISTPMKGDVHHKHRKLMNPAFSLGHIKLLTPVFNSVSKQVREVMAADIKRTGRTETDVLEMTGRAALELVAQGGFGHSLNALDGKPIALTIALKRFFSTSAKLFKFRPILPILMRTFPPWLLRRAGEMIPFPALHDMFAISDTLHQFATEIWTEKKQAHAEGKLYSSAEMGKGRDVLSLLLEENNKSAAEDRLPENELVAQVNTFLLAGTDTTATALARMLHLLALHPEAQHKLREELVEAGTPNVDLQFDTLDRLPYLEAVCRETLRLFPPVRFVQRQARQDHVLPLRQPVNDVEGKTVTEIFIPKGGIIMCSIVGVNCSEAIWGADAREWKPERWLKPLPQAVLDAHIPGVYANMLTFSGGARSCIGFKFSLLEQKCMLAQFIPSFEFEPSEEHQVSWWFGNISGPVVEDAKTKSHQAGMPLRVRCI
ncbi:cytochrome P450 [Peniophora sp. CONT]|nr:cytochrome P450 [Peniophora sp. CONT]